MTFGKKDVRKIKKATQEELNRVQKEYESFMKNVHGMSPAGLLALAVAGIVLILLFQNNILDLIGLAILLYALYVFVKRGAHRKGYFEGYYDMMTKLGDRKSVV